MNTKTQEAIKGVKELGVEVSAWENRVTYLQTEEAGLKRRNEQLKKDIDSDIRAAQVELDKKRQWSKQEEAKINELRAKLEADKVEFQGILSAFNKEKNTFETDRTKLLDFVEDTKRLREKLSNFITLVRRESERL